MNGMARLLCDLELQQELVDALAHITKLQRLIAIQRAHIELLMDGRSDFELSADALPGRPNHWQAG